MGNRVLLVFQQLLHRCLLDFLFQALTDLGGRGLIGGQLGEGALHFAHLLVEFAHG